MRYNNYHKHTHYSNIGGTPDSIVKPIDYVNRAIELGHTTLSTCEHGYAGNIFEYYDLAKSNGLKFIYCVEFYYVDDRDPSLKDRSNTHLVVMARNEKGKRAITHLISEANTTGYYYKPRIDKKLLLSLDPNDVVVTTACVGSYIGKHVRYEEDFVLPLFEHFGDSFYLEIQDKVHTKQIEYNKKILELHLKYNIPMIHACDSHYIYPEQEKDRDEFLQGKDVFYDDEEGFILDYPDSDTIFQRYGEQGVFTSEQVEQALKNTLVIDDFEDIYMDKEIKMPTLYPELTHEEKVKKLKDIITLEWKKDMKDIPKEKIKEYIDAIRFETQIVADTHMEDYFLINYEVIKKAKEKGGVLTRTGRGSAPSFYINKLLGFTEIDRVSAPVTLYPTRFMSKSRILETKSLPDIDFNCADQQPFIEATRDTFGDDHIFCMVAYGTMQDSEAFRNYCRALKMNMDDYNEVGKNLDLYRNDQYWGKIIEESKKFIGVIDGVSPHPCAFLLLDKPIQDEIGVIRTVNTVTKKVTYCCLIDSGTSDKWKYLKNDYLVVTVWDIINKSFNEVGKPIPNIRQLSSLVEGDKDVWKLYEDGMTATLNQTGSDSGTQQIMQYKPKSIRELSQWVAAIRPSFASMKGYFLDRQPFSYGIKEFDELLKESDNFILFQENIMAVLVYAGFEEDETYGLLKAIAKKKKGIIEPIQERFFNGLQSKGWHNEDIEKVWQIISDAVDYGFNSSHAYATALDSLYGAYLKCKYPLEYYAVVLNTYENNTNMTSKINGELNYFGIKVNPPKFRYSKAHYSANKKDNTIVKGLKSIKYLSEQIAEELYGLRDNEYETFSDLLVDIEENTSLNSRQMDILIKINFFEEFGENKELLMLYNNFHNRKEAYKKTLKKAENKIKRLEAIKAEEAVIRETNKDKKLSPNEQIMFEYEVLGYGQTTYPHLKTYYGCILDIDTKFTPRFTLYNMKTGVTNTIKMNKTTFSKSGLAKGDIIRDLKIDKKPKKVKINGQWVPSPSGETEPWLITCSKLK